ncbi:MAG: hypothetical protein K9L32_12450 [Chromatiaceae bacterium]|nr:hypothetical protein [Chromatiaceae bacterium]MCF8004984.1 hypothetical protein [Chromatiaceae bacterium]
MHIRHTLQRSAVLTSSLVFGALTVSAQAAEEQVPGNEFIKDEPGQQQLQENSQGNSGRSGEERPSEVRGLPDFKFPKNNMGKVERPPSHDSSSNLENSQNPPKQ